MQPCSFLSTTRPATFQCLNARKQASRPARIVLRHAGEEPKETSSGQDSYSRIEAPVRDGIPDGGKPVDQRNWGQEKLNPEIKSESSDPSSRFMGSDFSASDTMRFAGAIPEVANSRLAMLGIVAALAAEIVTGKNVLQQIQIAPVPIFLTFFIFTVATAVPVFKGVPRKGNSFFSSDAELINGRWAMVGFAGMVISTFYKGSALWFLP
ncbi:hypothetical protein WJX84_009569 [Apatococcus fuscideae]|uniref:Uncharacterized protein n=1 Tax=Apatococcus fuscideae TaxID=2026836 RepID=A0AAW1SW29_9CHLO